MARKPKPRRSKRPEPRAKVFWTGRSQAVRLPKEFRIDQESVRIRRNGRLIILEPDDDWQAFLRWAAENPIEMKIPPRDKRHRRLLEW